jgi:hypothetical protein
MKIPGKILAFIVLFLFTGHICLALDLSRQSDSLQQMIKQNQSVGEVKEQNKNGYINRQGGNFGKNNATRTIKRVKGARPDMSKAKGARPPVIVRPSGSRIPKGVGRPAGAFRSGHK